MMTVARVTRRAVRLAVVLALAAGALGCGRAGPPHRKRDLVKLPETSRRGTIVVADDGEGYAYVRSGAEGQHVVTPAGEGPPHRECYRPQLAPKTGRPVYWARDGLESAGGILLVADGRVAGTGFGAIGTVVFSADGTRWAAIAGTPSTGTGDDVRRGETVLLADGKELERVPDASLPTFSPDGHHLAYLVEDPPGRTSLVVDGEKRPIGEEPGTPCAGAVKVQPMAPNLPLQFLAHYLADGSLLTLAQDRDGWAVSRDGARLASYPANLGDPRLGKRFLPPDDACAEQEAIVPTTFSFAEKAPLAFWWERRAGADERWRVVRNGEPVDDVVCGHFWDDPPPEVTPDGRHVAYSCMSIDPLHPEYVYVVKDGERFGPYRDAWGMAFSEDPVKLVYDARSLEDEPTWSVYVDGQIQRGRYQALWRPRPDPHARRIAWEGQETWDPSGTGVLALDGKRIAGFDQILWGPTFTGSREVSWAFRRRRRVVRLDLRLD